MSKLLVLAAVIALVWVGFRLIGRLDQARKQEVKREAKRAPRSSPSVEETVRCRVCDAFVASRGATSCGRSDCPY